MDILPKDTPLGKLRITKVHIYYDGPKLFTAESKSGQQYLSFWLGEHNRSGEDWLYLPVSPSRLQIVLKKEISLRTACLNPEDGWVWLVTTNSNRDQSSAITMKPPSTLKESQLPAQDAYLSSEVTKEKNIEETGQYAERSMKEVLDIEFSSEDIKYKRIPAEYLGSALSTTQNIILYILYSHQYKPKKRGRIPEDVKRKSRMMAVDSYPSSFGIRIESRSSKGLFDNTSVGDAIQTLTRLVRLGDDSNDVIPILRGLGSRVVSKYIDFLNVYKQNEVDFNMHWGSPRNEGSVISSEMDYLTAESTVDMLSEKIEEFTKRITVKGVLEGVDIQSKRFKILNLDSEERITGSLNEDFVSKAKNVSAEVPKTYKAVLEVTQKIDPVTQEPSENYELIDLAE
jgi:hypothetical protein